MNATFHSQANPDTRPDLELMAAIFPAQSWSLRILLVSGAWTLLFFCLPPLARVLQRSEMPSHKALRDIRTITLPPPTTPPLEPIEATAAGTPAPPVVPMPAMAQPRLDPALLQPEWALPRPDLQGYAGVLMGIELEGAADLIFALAEVDTPPRPLFQPSPRYPYNARQAGIEGWAEIEFVVTADGQVTGIRVIRSHPGTVFDAAALDAVARWRFKAGSRRGEPVAVRVHLPLEFKLER